MLYTSFSIVSNTAFLFCGSVKIKSIESIYYSSDGMIKSYDSDIDNDIDVILNLNCSADAVTLPQNRKAVLDTIEKEVSISLSISESYDLIIPSDE